VVIVVAKVELIRIGIRAMGRVSAILKRELVTMALRLGVKLWR